MQRILQLFSRALRLSLVVGLLCCTAATARAQGGGEPINLNATLTVTLTERPATAVLDEITRKTGIKFAYDPEDIRRLPAVSGEFKKVTVHELLDKCIAGSTFKYAIENNVVLVYDSTVKMRKFTVSGTVRDAGKTVLPGASVILKGGSGQGVSTDEKGQFTFSFSTKTSPAVLEVGFLGMETQQVIITGSAKGLNVTLKEGGTRIDDVVVNGMFTRNKSTYTGSVTSIKGEDLVAISNTNLMSALSAVTPGMVVVQNNALGSNPNAIPEILIRGSNSIATSAEEKAYNNPLIILDGAEISMEELYDLDMYEIERIDVLKDAQASIVYGDRAANGVIVIERQQVTDSKPRLSYNFVPELSIPDLSSMNLCNAAQKLELERLAGLYESDNGAMDKAYAYKLQNVRRGVNTDWIRAPLRVPFSHTHSLSLSGRAQKIDYRASLRFSDKYGKGRERRTELREFDSIEATKVAVTNAKLYVDRAEGFFGIGKSMKDAEFVCDCSDIDDVIVFTKDGRYVITKVSDKAFFDKNIYYIGVFKRNDDRTIYNVLYRDGKNGAIMMKRCAIKGITRDKEYDITKGTAKSEILYMSVNPNGEAEVLKVYFKPRPRLKKVIVDLDFSTLAIKGRQSQGNLFSRYGIHKIVLKERGTSTLGGQDIWFDEDVRRLNADGRGKLLGEFKGDDRLIVWTSKNQYYITGYDLMQHFPDDTVLVARYESDRVYSLCYYDRGQKYYYMKRFTAEMSDKIQDFLDADADFICVTDRAGAKLEITYKGAHASRPADVIDVDEFVGVKSHRAKGKRLTTYDVDRLRMIEPELPPEPEPSEDESLDDGQLTDASADAAQRAAAEGKASGKSALKEPLGAKPAPGKASAGQPSAGTIVGGVEFEVERPKGDAGEMIDPEQLNLF